MKLLNWIKEKGWKYFLLAIFGYGIHILIEAFIVTNLLASIGLSIPTFV